MKTDTIIAGLLFVATAAYLINRRLPMMVVWVILGAFVGTYGFQLHKVMSVVLGIATALAVMYFSNQYYVENFEQGEKEVEKKEPSPAPAKTADPHVDIGTTILHAYRNLTPEQIGGMRRDTKELMELQKELMGTLAEMKPAIEQGAELLGTFSSFFGQGE